MTTEGLNVDAARSAVWAAYYEVQAAVQNPGAPAPDMLRAIATLESAIIRERDEAIALLRRLWRETNTYEVLGEYAALEVNHATQSRERRRLDPFEKEVAAFLARFPATPEEGRRDE